MVDINMKLVGKAVRIWTDGYDLASGPSPVVKVIDLGDGILKVTPSDSAHAIWIPTNTILDVQLAS